MSAKKTALSQKNLLFTCLALLVVVLALFFFLRPAPSISENADDALYIGSPQAGS